MAKMLDCQYCGKCGLTDMFKNLEEQEGNVKRKDY